MTATLADLLEDLMVREPYLSAFGFGLYREDRKKPRAEQVRILARYRDQLRASTEDIGWTVTWLRENIAPIQTINSRHSSYGLKHIAETTSPNRYLTNGTFITAAMILGYKWRRFSNGPNASFAMSEGSIRKAAILSRKAFDDWRAVVGSSPPAVPNPGQGQGRAGALGPAGAISPTEAPDLEQEDKDNGWIVL